MLEVIWTAMAQRHLQRIFADNEARRAGSGVEFLAKLDAEIERLRQFPESAPRWSGEFHRLVFHRRLGVFYAIHGNRLAINGLFPLTMRPESIRRRLDQSEWP